MSIALSIALFETGEEASASGFNYAAQPDSFDCCTLDRIVIVKKGTVKGSPTIDFLLTDSEGKTHVAITTARLLVSALRTAFPNGILDTFDIAIL